ncbi:MAG: 6-phospho-beta-glucosidase [Anaerolineae bacterium]
MKIATIGGGSTYTPELVQGFIARHERLGLKELWLVDIAPERLEMVGAFARRMVQAVGSPFTVHLTTDRAQALDGAAFVTTQLRVGGMAARREDEYLGRRWNLVGQETTGIGGMANALRTVPVIVDIAREMRQRCPDAWLINFANPSGLVAEALQRYVPETSSIGLCNGPIGYQMQVARMYDVADPFSIELDYLGLNHLAWIRGVRAQGRDVWLEVLARVIEHDAESEHAVVPAAVLRELGVICTSYLQYYYNTERVLAQQREGGPSRAERVMAIEGDLLKRYGEPELTALPEELMERGGAYYSTVAVQLIEAIVTDLDQVHIINTRHGEAVPGVPADWVLELPCRVGARGPQPLPAAPLPTFADGLMRAVKSYELLTAEAALTGDRSLALQALLAHPLGPDADVALQVLDDMLTTNRAHLPLFFGEEGA